ncbi:DUF2254 domain-containing protein [Oleiagrimonas sp. C23AA]|uniref:DUF2254 domain-containing protein n=1 Tax=Oleiagrimonas sp. C23AA TaxID=2719047 RepID=UPI001422C393|nr:DUF2254 domain-containing protein [Oleiagrimonas sp. C23AA]NII10544.1 DUF2254 domain-containing protein [Oleiagrimonas sp. C23AA]
MNAQWRLLLAQISRRLWFRSALYGVGAAVAALVGVIARPWLPTGMAAHIGASAVGSLLNILASSMLAVTTFSLSTMVSAYTAASSGATPRAATLLIEDAAAQRALASFIGAFLFSIVGLIALNSGIYGESGRVVLFAATVVMIVIIVVTLLRWIDQLSRLGRVTETIDRVEQVTRQAMQSAVQAPHLQAMPYTEPSAGAQAITATQTGYITYIDVADLQALADEHEARIWCEVRAGAFMAPGEVLAKVTVPLDDDTTRRLRKAFVTGDTRNFQEDPRFGLIVLTEIAQRALSPAVNDPGTAIDILGTVTRLLCNFASARMQAAQNTDDDAPRYERVYVQAPDEAGFFDDVFAPLARDAAPLLEVDIKLHKSLATLGGLGYPPYRALAARHARRALELSAPRLPLEDDRRQLATIAEWADETA